MTCAMTAALFAALTCAQAFGFTQRIRTPEVSYISPRNDSTVGLAGQKSLMFRWKPAPIPANGRGSYKFYIYKGFGYNPIYTMTLGPNEYTAEVPVNLFEKGSVYSWGVKQRDAFSMVWSGVTHWSFKAGD